MSQGQINELFSKLKALEEKISSIVKRIEVLELVIDSEDWHVWRVCYGYVAARDLPEALAYWGATQLVEIDEGEMDYDEWHHDKEYRWKAEEMLRDGELPFRVL